ncbi:TPA: hypothetical protein M8G11_003966 [Escherichia coli O157:H7]|uniref:Uncharacterized protein n=1 Tax=Escherichia coli TaxID=562 RepID=A0A6N0IEC4_ECOLX|nr:hypothetical protein HPE44_02705 [Escherichia coli]HCA6003825.1 hypothetical protein [Escherichia coli O157:H7]HAH9098948.1 hypothetical protein [Escherichia coli]HAM8432474.1 hypothetical protein [Escherichia coli]HCA6146766.1 hypothetical protein [Escherichia coli O157:H7]
MEKDYLRISSTVLVSLLFGLALVLVNSWFNQPGVEEVVPRSTYLMVMIALFFIDTVAFILCSCISFMTVGNFQTVYLVWLF